MQIILYIAMQEEAAAIISALNLEPNLQLLPQALPMQAYTGEDSYNQYLLITAGNSRAYGVNNVGTEPASVGLSAALEVFAAECVINAGTAGGFASKGAQIADVFLGKSPLCYHDHRIPLGHYEAYGIGRYPCVDSTNLTCLLNVKQGNISTGNSLDMNTDDLERLHNNQADCKDMEAAALAWVAELYNVPFLPIKVITDLIDNQQDNTAEQFLQNLTQANLALKDAVLRLLALPNLSALIKA